MKQSCYIGEGESIVDSIGKVGDTVRLAIFANNEDMARGIIGLEVAVF